MLTGCDNGPEQRRGQHIQSPHARQRFLCFRQRCGGRCEADPIARLQTLQGAPDAANTGAICLREAGHARDRQVSDVEDSTFSMASPRTSSCTKGPGARTG
jgi:hypothetical protein